MSESREIIEQIEAVFGNVDIPLCISVISSDAMELFATKNCPSEDEGSANILGVMAFEELKNALKRRSDKTVDMMVFRAGSREFFITPVASELFLFAQCEPGSVANVMTLLDGLSTQIRHRISKLL